MKKAFRSIMNVTFTSPDADTDKSSAPRRRPRALVNLKGHRLVGGMRASIYNAMPAEGVAKLVQFMEDFAKKNG